MRATTDRPSTTCPDLSAYLIFLLLFPLTFILAALFLPVDYVRLGLAPETRSWS